MIYELHPKKSKKSGAGQAAQLKIEQLDFDSIQICSQQH